MLHLTDISKTIDIVDVTRLVHSEQIPPGQKSLATVELHRMNDMKVLWISMEIAKALET